MYCFKSPPAGQRTLHHRSDVLDTVVLVNPSQESVVLEVRSIYSEMCFWMNVHLDIDGVMYNKKKGILSMRGWLYICAIEGI